MEANGPKMPVGGLPIVAEAAPMPPLGRCLARLKRLYLAQQKAADDEQRVMALQLSVDKYKGVLRHMYGVAAPDDVEGCERAMKGIVE